MFTNTEWTIKIEEANPSQSWGSLTAAQQLTEQQSKIDPIAVSCALHRLNNIHNGDHNFQTLSVPFSQLLPIDFDFANEIRAYFSHKLLHHRLTSDNMSKFRTDLSNLLYNHKYGTLDYQGEDLKYQTQPFPKGYEGMIYKLPYFYEYDKRVDLIFDGVNITIKGPNDFTSIKLRYITKLLPFRRENNNIEYWFDDEFGNKVALTVEKNNPLISIWEDHIAKEQVTITGPCSVRKRGSNELYEYKFWKLIK